MDTSKLPINYWETINDRILASVNKIVQRSELTTQGRVSPDDEDLAIGTGRKLKMSVLFLDICGFTSWNLTTHEQQEQVLIIFNLFMTHMLRIAQDYGGTVEKNTGDGLMAYFEGEGNNREQSACESAIAASQTMLYVTKHVINPLLSRSNMQTVDFRIGIDFGSITVAKIGMPRMFNSNVAIGISANIACKMLKEAGRNEIVLGEDVYLRLGSERKKYCQLLKFVTGFVRKPTSGSSVPYPFYKYNATWSKPL